MKITIYQMLWLNIFQADFALARTIRQCDQEDCCSQKDFRGFLYLKIENYFQLIKCSFEICNCQTGEYLANCSSAVLLKLLQHIV